ncbi:hypothetical protein MA16_Dca027967 [Dendrobium catenatum]|uniref:Uncharacterized protein n=1 Tax=Dendrobium catenatum TaxID=906689 RepID=A0A2I0VCE9_9ASPA|nr:hypothetical protein MA16_Dca027967 [Dendrobium catenatum]
MKHNVFRVNLRAGGGDVVDDGFDASEALLHRLILHLDSVQLVLELHYTGSTGRLKSVFKNCPSLACCGGRDDVRQNWLRDR